MNDFKRGLFWLTKIRAVRRFADRITRKLEHYEGALIEKYELW